MGASPQTPGLAALEELQLLRRGVTLCWSSGGLLVVLHALTLLLYIANEFEDCTSHIMSFTWKYFTALLSA